MKVYILTGAAGFIGSHLAEMLVRRGETVFGLDNFCDFYDPEIKRQNVRRIQESVALPGEFHMYEADLRSREALEYVFAEVRELCGKDAGIIVLHIAAMAGVRPSLKDPALYEEVNIKGTLNLLDLCRENGVRRFLFASSSSVYGNTHRVPFSEDDPVNTPISIYAATKKAGELLCHVHAHLYGMRTICLRFFTVYGAGQRPDLAVHKFTNLIDRGEPIPVFGDGTARRDYTYIDDIMDGALKAMSRLENDEIPLKFEIFNLGESRTVELSYLIELIEKEMGKKAVIERFPLQPGDVDTTYADISKAKEILGYNPQTPIEEGVKNFVQWYKDVGIKRKDAKNAEDF